MTAWNNNVNEDDDALKVFAKGTLDANQDVYKHATTTRKQRRTLLENDGLHISPSY